MCGCLPFAADVVSFRNFSPKKKYVRSLSLSREKRHAGGDTGVEGCALERNATLSLRMMSWECFFFFGFFLGFVFFTLCDDVFTRRGDDVTEISEENGLRGTNDTYLQMKN